MQVLHAHHFRRNLPQKEGKKTNQVFLGIAQITRFFFANMSSVMLKNNYITFI